MRLETWNGSGITGMLLALIAMANADPRPDKIDVGVGVYRDAHAWAPAALPLTGLTVGAAFFAVELFVVSVGTGDVPRSALITVPTVPPTMQCAHGYSGCMGVTPTGVQDASRGVDGLVVRSALRMAVIGRHRL